jgi:membrane protease subunit HflK
VAVLLAIWFIFGSMFFVASGEKAVVLRFGKYDRTVDTGLNFKFPPPFEKQYTRNVQNTTRVTIGDGSEQNLMVTGDENIVDVEFDVRWNITNLEDFLFNVASPDITAQEVAESAMREVIGSEPMSFALGEGEGRSKIAVDVQDRAQKMLDNYKSGIRIVAIDLKKIDVPAEVVDSQIDVQNAKTEQERVKNQAEAYSNDILPRAAGDAAKMIEDAEAYKQSVVAKAKGDTSRFLAVYQQYARAKDVTKSRIYLETMQEIMGNMNKVIIDDNSKTVPYLPLDSLRLGAKEEKNEDTK